MGPGGKTKDVPIGVRNITGAGAERRALIFEYRDIKYIWQFGGVGISCWAKRASVCGGQKCALLAVGCDCYPLGGQWVKPKVCSFWTLYRISLIGLSCPGKIRTLIVKVN
jgi:hypothetical protein